MHTCMDIQGAFHATKLNSPLMDVFKGFLPLSLIDSHGAIDPLSLRWKMNLISKRLLIRFWWIGERESVTRKEATFWDEELLSDIKQIPKEGSISHLQARLPPRAHPGESTSPLRIWGQSWPSKQERVLLPRYLRARLMSHVHREVTQRKPFIQRCDPCDRTWNQVPLK